MPFANFRSVFDPQTSDDQSASGLPGLLRQAMQQQALQRPPSGTSPNSTSNQYADSYGNPQGLFGRLLALQTAQGASTVAGGDPPSSSTDPTVVPVQYRIPMPGPLPFPPTGPQQIPQIPMPHLPEPRTTIGNAIQLLPGLTRDFLFKAWNERDLNKGDDDRCPNCRENDDNSKGYEGPERQVERDNQKSPPPLPQNAPFGQPPAVAVPSAPDSSDAASRILQLLYPSLRIFHGGGGGGGGGDDEEDCKEENRRAREICIEAFANDWKSEYGVGPHYKSSGEPWNVDDCKRGLMSESCGGNRYDRPPPKKIKRYRLR